MFRVPLAAPIGLVDETATSPALTLRGVAEHDVAEDPAARGLRSRSLPPRIIQFRQALEELFQRQMPICRRHQVVGGRGRAPVAHHPRENQPLAGGIAPRQVVSRIGFGVTTLDRFAHRLRERPTG